MSYPPEWPEPGKMHFRLANDRLGELNLDCDDGYVVTAYDLGFPDIREVKLNNSLDDGIYDVTRYFGGRAVSLDVTLKTHTGLTPTSTYITSESLLRDRLLAYLYPGTRSRLLFSEHGDQRVRQMMIRGTKASLAVSQKNYNKINASWIAPRGTLYSYDERCYLFRFGETSGDTMTLTIINEGNVPVDWRASISGYSVHPRLTLNGTEILRLEYDADPGDVIILEAFSRTITINGKPASYAYIDDDSTWFKIPPGTSTLTVQHAGGVTAAGYPYGYWQSPASGALNDLFERADGPLGSAWEVPAHLPTGTTSVPLAINSGEVVVTVADDGTGSHEWGFARNVTSVTGGDGKTVEIDVTNLAQTSSLGPLARSKVELYTNMADADAACQALAVDFDFGIQAAPVAPMILRDPFETLTADWTVAGTGVSLVAGRVGRAVQITGSSSLSYLLDPADESDVLIVGAAVQIVQSGTTITSTRTLFEFRSDAGATLHGTVAVDANGSVYATDAAGVNRGGSPAGTILPNAWYYVEARYVMHDTGGEFALHVDGAGVASGFNLDTINAGTKVKYDTIRLPVPNPTSGGTHQYDDLYISAGPDAPFSGPLAVANGSLTWRMRRYAADGTAGTVTASATIPFNYTASAVRVRLESAADGGQRFILNGVLTGTGTEPTPPLGPKVGFAANYTSISTATVAFSDDFERTTLGTGWVISSARDARRTTVLPTITSGAAVGAAHNPAYPTLGSSNTTTGTTLVGGVVQNLPASPFSNPGYLLIATCIQDNPSVLTTASAGWTQIGSVAQGSNVIRMTTFARVADGTSADTLTLTGSATNFATAVYSYLGPSGVYPTGTLPALQFASATGATGSADPPNLTLGGDWVVLTAAGLDLVSAPSMSTPASYLDIHGTTVSPGNLVALFSAYRQFTGTAENPGTFTAPSRPWIAFTIGIPGGSSAWSAAEQVPQSFDALATITAEALVNGTNGVVELYTHAVAGSPTCRALQVDLATRNWQMGHFTAGTSGMIVASSGALPTGAPPFTLRLEGDPDRTERFLFNGTLVSTVNDSSAPNPTVATRTGFGLYWLASGGTSPQVRSFAASGIPAGAGGTGTSPRIERFSGAPLSGANWSTPPGTTPVNNPAPAGAPPWAWTPPVDPLTGEPSILTVRFCFFDQWI